MFEGLVHQLLLGYLSRYFKDIQKQQLKIRLEEVLLENVELILEAFDYLQLPFALKQGRVGKLSIKIPWKKPWDPIIIILEDVFISASQRDDQEWSADAVEKREFAGKKAKLAAAELGKLSRRVSGGLAGQSFISHVTAKILDSIQVDIRNLHFVYSDVQNDLGHIMFGLKFSNLTMKQNLVGSSNGRVSVAQEQKIVEVKGLEIYSSMHHSSMDLVIMNTMGNSYSASTIGPEGKQYNSILAPFDVTLILSANRSQKPDDNAAQYSVTAELSGLVISLDEVQLQQMFLVWDYVCTCRLREKYGRFRPWHCPLLAKCEGWQILWWRYAKDSILSDIRKKLKKTSWKYFGYRLYVISNACSKEIIYKQKGTDVMFYLGIGEHTHLHWTDTSRELLVSICYNETGWQWSGSFLPDHLGDTQLKMRNFVLGTSNMIRVEVQNADISMGDEKIVGNIKGNSGTNLILLSDDYTGYMPYRIDNFSKEILRIYQQRCEIFDTVIHCYASYPYVWDEPCSPHRLVVEVPGERVLGSYALDDVKEYMPVYLPSTSEKPERTFFISVHAEGATKVLSVLDSSYHNFNEAKKSSVPHASEKRLYDHSQVRPTEYQEKISISLPYIGISLINSYPQELIFACIKDIQINLLQSLDRQRLSMQISFIQIDNQLRSTPYPVMLSFGSGYRSCQADYMKSRDEATRSRIEKSNPTNICSSSSVPVFCLEISKWKKKDISFLSFEYIKLRMADFRLEIEQEVILSLFEFFTNISSGLQYGIRPSSNHYYGTSLKDSSSFVQTSENLRLNADQSPLGFAPILNAKSKKIAPLPSIIPIGAPWQEIYLLARTQKKIYIEMLELAPIKLTLSFSSAPWMLHNRILTSKEFLIHRGLMALADVEGAHIYLKDLTIAHHMASWESIQEILIRHYNRQLLHETYKLFGSAGVIGNPLGFARSMGHGIRDFLSVPANNIMQSPAGLIMGMAEGTTSLLSNTLYAISDAASQFSKVARKGIVAFTYDDHIASRMEKQQATVASDSKGVINEVLEGLTGLLQSPIRGAERHGLPGVLSGVALGITGLVAKPAASILEVTGKTAQSIRNRSKPNQLRSYRFRVRLPRPLCNELPLRSYSWEEAVGASVLMEADDGLKFKDEKLAACKGLKEAGKFVVLTERYIMIVFSPSLINLGKPEFCGISADLEWIIEWEIGLESIIHADCDQGVVHIVSSRPDSSFMHNQDSPKRGGSSRTKAVHWNHYPTHLPLPQTDLELACEEDAFNLLQILLSGIEKGKGRAWDCGRILHRASMKAAV